ncbi:MAG: tRNA (guanosine(37)-N1)-methyltransferase TrmD [Patescibacteria group bacterium]|nr:tRNA (guanosine(37)-N1)-methyltransferase TrmD [Patescibacteria group bacterium]
MINFEIISIFPKIFDSYFNTSIINRAQKKKLIKIKIHDLRKWTEDKHKTVDDRPYGGGPGMLLKPLPIYKAIRCLSKCKNQKSKCKIKEKIILLTPDGKQFNQKMAHQYAKLDHIIFVCGHYEGFDARIEKFVDEKISTGPYILTGGEIPAMAIVDAVTRLIPGVIKSESLQEETFSFRDVKNIQNSSELVIHRETGKVLGEYPQYTRPEILIIKNKKGINKKLNVPKILLTGNHKKIEEWKLSHLK